MWDSPPILGLIAVDSVAVWNPFLSYPDYLTHPCGLWSVLAGFNSEIEIKSLTFTLSFRCAFIIVGVAQERKIVGWGIKRGTG